MMDPYRGIVDPDPGGRHEHAQIRESWWSYAWWVAGLVLLVVVAAVVLRLLL